MEKQKNLANTLMGMGLLLTVVPVGVGLMTWLQAPSDPMKELRMLGWAWIVVAALLPGGVGLSIGAFAWMTILKKREIEEEEVEEEKASAEVPPKREDGERPNLIPPTSG